MIASMPAVRRLEGISLDLPYQIDRSEHIDLVYVVEGGRLHGRQVAGDVPPWDPVGSGDHSVRGFIADLDPLLERGGILLGAFEGGAVQGIAVVIPG